MRIAFMRRRSGGLLNRPSPRKRLLPKKKTSSGFEFVSGLADGASAMPAKWSRPVFSFRFYEGKISRALIVNPVSCRSTPLPGYFIELSIDPNGEIRTLFERTWGHDWFGI